MRFAVVGLNHKTASLAHREAIAVAAERTGPVLAQIAALDTVAEACLLSTCNRVELYLVTEGDPAISLAAAEAHLVTEGGCDPDIFTDHGYRLYGEDAVRHFFRVTASLDSMVLGEPQILGQVKAAAAVARGAGTVGPFLDRVLSISIRAAKRVRTETEIGKMRVSVGSVAVDLARRIFSRLSDCKVLLLGAGKMGEATARSLAQAGASRVYVVNRSIDRARNLAAKHGWRSRNFDELDELLARVDVVITSTGAPEPVIGEARMRRTIKARKYRPLFLVDIAVPRDVAPEVGALDTIYLYNVDDLISICAENLDLRAREAAVAETMIEEAVGALAGWVRQLQVGPTIAAIRGRVAEIGHAELARTMERRLKHLSEEDQEAITKMLDATVSKWLHTTMVALKESANGAGTSGLIAAARVLYGLEIEREVLSDGDDAEVEG